MLSRASRIVSIGIAMCGQCLLFFSPLQAQLKGDHLLGEVGLQAGTQGPPGLYLAWLPAYDYSANKLKNDHGDVVADHLGISAFAFAPGLSWVLNQKFMGGNIGGSVLVPFMSNKIESNIYQSKSPIAFSDLYIQPLILGWHNKMADWLVSFNLYIPTGKYELGATDNSGLGMWAYEFSAGATFYLDKAKTWHFAAMPSYEFNSKKKGTDIKVGNLLSVEGGLGKTWYVKTRNPVPLVINAGLAYYLQYKTTHDQLPIDTTLAIGGKDHIYGLGAEANIYIASIRSLFDFRWLTETGAINRLQGNTYVLTWVFTIKPFENPKKQP